MDIVYWLIIIALFIIAFIGLVYPVIPSVLFLIAGFLVYGLIYGFDHYSWVFWVVQGIFFALLMVVDYAANLFGVKKFGGSKAAIWGSTIGLLIGPFVIPVAGIILGPFLGAIIAEILVHKKDFKTSLKIGIGSLLGFLSGTIAKGLIQLAMIIYFLFEVL
ncbi:DUF456 domain-containing protein [Bacillus sp. PS06]|uniref:DUF456 domain-containing protein n=1 Tax=Bacillus sp. PS06 TaxID=2764176 RepID=UPI00177CFB4E|nr:DUF456 domain-containing protein [Bacillus sp. PS06]MBD8069158.1 DUF456 domain-containing protein [Bacillus sp. PS06]